MGARKDGTRDDGVEAVNQDFSRYEQVRKDHSYRLSEGAGAEQFDETFTIRTCDMRQFFDGGVAGRKQFAAELGSALESIGFAILTGHGVDAALYDEAAGKVRQFFEATPRADRARYLARRHGSVNQGYFPLKETTIRPMQDGPYVIEGLTDLRSRKGPLETQPRMALCRCGESSNKPFCDGTHAKVGFSSAKLDGRPADKRDNYAGSEITIHDNRGICAHAGRCTEGLPAVFKLGTEPWIDPNGAGASEIREVIKICPSGALSVTVGGVEHRDGEGDPAVFIAPNGPYVVSGGPELLETPRGEGATTEHCTLCRCGGSKNKPFCDGTHWNKKFIDDKN